MGEEENKLNVLSHLQELRGRLVKSLIAIAIGIAICFPLARYLFDFLLNPVPGIDLYYTNVTGLLGSYMKVCLYGGLAISMPFILYQVIMFVKPALTRKEKGYLYTLLPAVILLFVGGVVFCYFVLLPPALRFLYYTFPTFVGGEILPWWTVGDYVSVVTRLLFWLGMVFEIPLVMFFLSKIGVISPEWVARKWKYAVVFAFIIGAIITPTFDPINQSLVAGPVIVLYALGYVLTRVARIGRAPVLSASAETESR
ncbi:MAG: twin-arginine translocase subunit TatC [Chloroflexota bacterium]|nr:twin-arginine translocase subunit TatC [Chloroflexota bacterium]